jgi:hypothetical protein
VCVSAEKVCNAVRKGCDNVNTGTACKTDKDRVTACEAGSRNNNGGGE